MKKEDYPKLLNCPFCGGKAKLFVGNFWVWIRCTLCEIDTKPFDITELGKDRAIEEAVKCWNRRADNG